jgi:peroxiredoxin
MNMLKNNKNILFAISLTFFSITAMAQTSFVINGQLSPDINDKKIILTYKNNGLYVADSGFVKAGKFSFKGVIGDPAYARLSVDPPAMTTMQNVKTLDNRDFFLEGGKVEVNSATGVKSARIKGGKTQVDFQKRLDLYKPIQARVDSLNSLIEQYKAGGDQVAIDAARKEMDMEFTKTAKIDSNFIKENLNSFVSLDLWRSKHKGTLRSNFEPEFLKFGAAIRNTFAGKEIQAKFDLAKSLAPGQMAPDFNLTDTAGKTVSLSSLRGKNVFVCFYTPDFMNYDAFTFNLSRINRALRDKNVVMLTVYYNYTGSSLSYWKETIDKSRFTWMNLNDMNGVNDKGAVSTTAKLYGLSYSTLPTALLIGADGKILASQLRLNDTDLSTDLVKLIK